MRLPILKTDKAYALLPHPTAVYLEMPLSDKASDIESVLNEEHDAIMTYSKSIDEGIADMNSRVSEILAG